MEEIIYIGLAVLVVASYLCLYRIGRGPTAPDRTVAIDILGVILVGFCALLSVLTGQGFYISVALAWALLSFIGTIALAKHLEGRGFDE
ncbi:MAG: cation:proton antiporter [Planctomycetes bacterium]|nr:cation:proton antiporter [Planctomycetota bacterium]